MKDRAILLKSLTRLTRGVETRYGKRRETRERFAFTAIVRHGGSIVVRVEEDRGAIWPQQEYGYFESWTQAQAFAMLLNQLNGIGPLEAQQVIVSAQLASKSVEQTH